MLCARTGDLPDRQNERGRKSKEEDEKRRRGEHTVERYKKVVGSREGYREGVEGQDRTGGAGDGPGDDELSLEGVDDAAFRGDAYDA